MGTFRNVWRQSSGTFCTWTLTSNDLKTSFSYRTSPNKRSTLFLCYIYMLHSRNEIIGGSDCLKTVFDTYTSTSFRWFSTSRKHIQIIKTKGTSFKDMSLKLIIFVSSSYMKNVTFHRKRSTFQNVWRPSSGTFCTWTLTSNVLKSTPFPMECHKWEGMAWRHESIKTLTLKFRYFSYLNYDVNVLKHCPLPTKRNKVPMRFLWLHKAFLLTDITIDI